MTATRHINPEDLALFALQFLSSEQNQQVRTHLEYCAECRAELALIQGDLAVLASTAEMHPPSVLARERLLQTIAREPRQQASASSRRFDSSPYRATAAGESAPTRTIRTPGPGSGHAEIGAGDQRSVEGRYAQENVADDAGAEIGRSRGRSQSSTTVKRVVPQVLSWAGWAIAASLAIVTSQAMHERNSLRSEVESTNHQIAQVTAQGNEARRLKETLDDPTAQRVTLTLSKQAPLPQGKATYVPAKGALVFLANNLEPLEPAKAYELWIIPAGGSAPVPAGTFHPDAGGNASLLLPQLPLGITAKAFGITIEEEGGSQTPTMPILMAGAAGL